MRRCETDLDPLLWKSIVLGAIVLYQSDIPDADLEKLFSTSPP